MNAIEEIKKAAITEPVKLAVKTLLASGCTLLLFRIPPVYSWLTSKLSVSLALALIGIEFLLLSVAGSYIVYLRRKYIPKLIYKFGILWDKEQNPFCPKCSKRLGPYTQYVSRAGCRCHHCKEVFPLLLEDGSGSRIGFAEAVAKLRQSKAR